LSYEVGFNYQGESGSLEESWCDVFGALVERSAIGESNNTWKIGEDVYTPNISDDAIRYLNNPLRAGQPDHMSGYNDTTTDCHQNAAIPSLAFYLFAKGGSHRLGGYTAGVGVEIAAKVWYYAMQYYMTPSTNFLGARTATSLAVKLLYPSMDYYYTEIQNAWGLVGVGANITAYGNESIVNGALEQSVLPWVTLASNYSVYVKSGLAYKSAKGYLMLGCMNSGSGKAYQIIGNISSNAVYANLTFWLSVKTDETPISLKFYLWIFKIWIQGSDWNS